MRLQHRHFVIGITGGIAAYKTCELIRRLMDEGASVQVVMTEGGTQFVSPLTFQALSGRPVYTQSWSSPERSGPDNGMPHIDLSREADAILVAPASADFMARLASGQTPDLLTTLCLAREIPLLVAPAMNRQMWNQPATQRNIAQLRLDGVVILGPGSGAQACGEVGDGRMLEPADLLDACVNRFGPESHRPSAASGPNIRGVLQGRKLVMTAGPTFEAIDEVRGVTNRSSGKMGFALAKAAREAGAEVVLIAGPVGLRTPDQVTRIDVTSAQEMHDAVHTAIQKSPIDCFVSVAAVADWRPSTPIAGKIKKHSEQSLSDIQWVENLDILASVAALPNPPFCVGFAAESGDRESLRQLLPAKRERKNIPMLVGNIGANTFGQDHNEILICDDSGLHDIPAASKDLLARTLIARIAAHLQH
jgi:phosphopantothenoylcysteine decarboxylase/phosphopantothenate--cysteine ligase